MSTFSIGGIVIYIQKENISARDYILQALYSLLHKEDFEAITVKQIVMKAGVSRSTFYIHFEDKYQLMDCLRETITSKFLAYYETNGKTKDKADLPTIQSITLLICRHISKYRNFYKHELNQPIFTQKLCEQLAEKLVHVFEDKSYAIFASYGTIGYLSHWVKDNHEMDPEEAAKQLIKIGMTNWSVDVVGG